MSLDTDYRMVMILNMSYNALTSFKVIQKKNFFEKTAKNSNVALFYFLGGQNKNLPLSLTFPGWIFGLKFTVPCIEETR